LWTENLIEMIQGLTCAMLPIQFMWILNLIEMKLKKVVCETKNIPTTVLKTVWNQYWLKWRKWSWM
jgi:hypothetical protein